VSDSLDDVASSGFAFCADHGGALRDTAQGLAETAAAADEGDLVRVLVDVVDCVSGGQDFGLVDVVYAEGFEDLERYKVSFRRLKCFNNETYLALDKVSNSCLGHDGNGDSVHDLLDHLGVAHTGYATL
jgi:hypothetical protein